MKYLKLMYAFKKSPTLVNMDFVKTMYTLHDPKGIFDSSTKILFKDDTYINVSEDLQTILKLTQEYEQGKYQEIDWETPVATPQQRFESAYKTRPRLNNEKNFNSVQAFNDTMW